MNRAVPPRISHVVRSLPPVAPPPRPVLPTALTARGVLLANWSSPHDFQFNDGTTLRAVDPARASRLRLIPHHQRVPRERWVDLRVRWGLSPEVLTDLLYYSADAAMAPAERQKYDILIVSRDALSALRDAGHPIGCARSIVRTGRGDVPLNAGEFAIGGYDL